MITCPKCGLEGCEYVDGLDCVKRQLAQAIKEMQVLELALNLACKDSSYEVKPWNTPLINQYIKEAREQLCYSGGRKWKNLKYLRIV